MEPFTEGSRKNPPKIKGFSVEPFIDGSRKNLYVIKYSLVEPFLESSREKPLHRVLPSTKKVSPMWTNRRKKYFSTFFLSVYGWSDVNLMSSASPLPLALGTIEVQ